MMKIQIIVFAGFDELDVIAPFEVLRDAMTLDAALRVEVVTLDGSPAVVAAHGLPVRVDRHLQMDDRPDLLIVPGGGWNDRAALGAWAEARRGDLPAAIARVHAAGTTIAAVCTGGMLVTATGLTVGWPATTHHSAIEEMRAAGAEIIDARVVDDGDLITAGGVTSGLDLALWLVERYSGARTAAMVERQMDYERRGTVWRRT